MAIHQKVKNNSFRIFQYVISNLKGILQNLIDTMYILEGIFKV